MYIFILALLCAFFTGFLAYGVHYDTDMVVNTTLSLALAYSVSCVRILSEDDRLDNHVTFEVYKRISTSLYKTAAVYPFSKYVEVDNKKLMKKTCFKPIKLLMADDDTKEKFADISRKIRMSDSLWLIYINDTITEFFSNVNLPFDVELIAAQVKNRDLVEFQDVYRVDKNYPMRIGNFGNWSRSDGLSIPLKYLYKRRSDLEGKLLRVGSIENWPMSSFKGGVWDGYFPRIWKELSYLINSTTKAYRSRDNATGSLQNDGTWSGLVGMILDDSIDVIAAEITINKARSEFVSFSRPVLMTRYKVYFTSPKRELKWGAAFQPFGADVWMALLIWMVVGTISLGFCYSCSWSCGVDSNVRKVFDGTESFFFVLQTLCQQGYPDMPRSISCRLVVLSCFLVSSVLIPSYSASVISSLTHVSPDKPFDTLREMLQEGSHKLLVIPNSGQHDYFKRSSDPLNQAIMEKLINTVPRAKQVKSIKDALEKAFCKFHKYAFFSTQKIFEMKIEHSPLNCPLVSLTEELAAVYQGLVLQKGSPYEGLINYHLQRLHVAGIINRIDNSMHRLHTHDARPIFKDVNVEDSFQIFFLLTCGLILSTVLLIIEKSYFRCKKRKHYDTKSELNKPNHDRTFRNEHTIPGHFHLG